MQNLQFTFDWHYILFLCKVKVINVGSDTFGNPIFQKAYASWVDLPSLATLSKIWPNFSNKVVEKLILSKNANNKKCASKFVFFNEKKIEKDSDDF